MLGSYKIIFCANFKKAVYRVIEVCIVRNTVQ